MAKRRSMNRRWSRRSANNSAFLNDDTNILDEDDNYWQYLNQTTSRPPSGVNITAATAVLDPDSNIIDSNASASQWEYLEKSSDNILQQNPTNPSKSSEKEGSSLEKLPEDPTDSEASAKVRKKRPRLRKPRNPKSKNVLVLNSSDSTGEMNPPAPPQPAKSLKNPTSQVLTQPTSPQDSITSLESEKIEKRRTRFRKHKRLDKSIPISDNSVVLPSQESRKSSIRPRSTFLNKSPDKRESKSAPQDGRTSDTGSDQLVAQPRKVFGRMRKFKVSGNPFAGILDETEVGNQTNVSSPNETRKSQNENSDSGNFVLQITPVASGEQQRALRESKSLTKQREINELSGSSISEELKISQTKSSERTKKQQSGAAGDEEEDSDEYQSFEDTELKTSVQKTVIGTSLDDRQDFRGSKKKTSSKNADNTEETMQEESSNEVQAINGTRTTRQSHIESNKSPVHSALENRSRSTRSLILTSSRSKRRDQQQTMNSKEELNAEAVSEGESIFSPNKFNISDSKVHSSPRKDPNSITENGKKSRKTLEPENFTRPGPKSSKSSNQSLEISSIQSPTETAEVKKSTGDKDVDKSHRPDPSSQKSLIESFEDDKMSEEEQVQRRPGPKSFKKTQRSVLLTSRDSNTSKISAQIPESPHKLEQMDNETESLSESSSRKDTRKRTNPSLYELPAQERSPSISVSESDHEPAVSSVAVDSPRPLKSPKLKRQKIEQEDEKDRPLAEKSLNASPRSSAHSRRLISPKATIPSTSSRVDETVQQKKQLRQLKIDALMRHNKPQSSQLSQTPRVPFDPLEFKKKLEESKKVLKRMRAKEDEAERKRSEKVKGEEIMVKKVTKGFKGLAKIKKPDKIVDRAFIVNGKVYKRPKLPRPKHWATNKFYKFLWKKMEPKFGEQYRVKSEKFVVELNEVMTVIMRRKKYDNYKGELEGLLKRMAELGIIETRHDFHGFCFDFLPYEFRIKVVPMLRAGNTHNIPFEPEKLLEPIME